MTGRDFLKTHWEVSAAIGFFTVEPWMAGRLIRYHVLFIIRRSKREVQTPPDW